MAVTDLRMGCLNHYTFFKMTFVLSAYRSVDFLLDSSLRKVYGGGEKHE